MMRAFTFLTEENVKVASKSTLGNCRFLRRGNSHLQKGFKGQFEKQFNVFEQVTEQGRALAKRKTALALKKAEPKGFPQTLCQHYSAICDMEKDRAQIVEHT